MRELKHLSGDNSNNTFLGTAERWPGNVSERVMIGLQLCREANTKPCELLDLGLCMMRRLPINPGEGYQTSESWWPMVGFLEWVRSTVPADEDVKDVFDDLLQLYPRLPAHWRSEITAVIRQHIHLGEAAARLTHLQPPARKRA